MSPSSEDIDKRWDVEQTLDWLQSLQERRRRRRRRRNGDGNAADGTAPTLTSNVDDADAVDDDDDDGNEREATIRRVVLQFPDALLPVALAVQSRLDSGAASRGLDLEVCEE